MMITITKGQPVAANPEYITCDGGEFDMDDFVQCKRIDEKTNNTVQFLARQIQSIEY